MKTLEQMTPEEKLGRVLCARRFETQEDIDFTLDLVKRGACGALQIRFNDKTREMIKTFRDAADYPIIVVNDMECGFPLSSLPSIPMVTLAACGNSEYTRIFAAAIAREAKEMGFSGCWSPVVDILAVDGPCSVARKAGDTPEAVTAVTRDILTAFDSYRFHGAAKHYPGGHDDPVDTHMAEGTSSADAAQLLSFDLVPYLDLMKEGLLPSVMVGHQVCPKVDDLPASLSKKVIDLLRNEGFDGVMYTDSLAMMGILQKYGEGGAMAMALMAGNDIILPNYRTPTKKVYEMMLDAYREGKITDERLDEAVRRVMRLEQYCAEEPVNPIPVPENVEEILENIVRDSITAKCAEGVSLTLDPEKPRLFVIMTPENYDESSLGAEITMSGWYDPRRVKQAILDNFPNATVVMHPEYPKGPDNEILLNKATAFDEVVFVSYCTTTAYIGTDGLTRRAEAIIRALAIPKKLVALVHFGNPLATNPLSPLPRVIYGYTAPAAQTYAFEVLAGKIPARGKMPFPRLLKQ